MDSVPPRTPAPLEGVRVLTLENFVAAPLTTMLLADWGADVLKVEPAGGDIYRTFPPIVEHDGSTTTPSFARVNRNKRSIHLDLPTDEGRSRFFELVSGADVVVQNLRPGALDRLGLGYPALKGANPKIILVSLSGFGQADVATGPLIDLPALDLIGQAMSGLAVAAGKEDEPPRYVGFPLIDTATGDWGAMATLLALRWRDVTGRGQHVDISMYDVSMHLNEYNLGYYGYYRRLPPRGRLGSSAPFDFYRAEDGWFALAVAGEPIWRRLCVLIGRPELLDDPNLSDGTLRASHEGQVREAVEAWSSTQSVDTVCASLVSQGIPASPAKDAAAVFDDPHAAARGSWMTIDDPVLGPVTTVSNPVRSNAMPPHPTRPAPALGAHDGWGVDPTTNRTVDRQG